MGSVAANFIPAITGLALGTPNQQWIVYASNVFGSTFQSNTLNPALSGILRLASGDGIGWRNNTNLADVLLSKTGGASGNVPADSLTFNGGGFLATFLSQTANPAASGQLRLATGDAVNFRNFANGADINGLSKNSSDVVVVGGAAGISIQGISSTGSTITGNESISGNLSVAGTTSSGAITAPSVTSPTALALQATTVGTSPGQPVSIIASSASPSGGVTAGGSIFLTGGASGSASGGVLFGTIQTNTIFSSYGGVTLVRGGLAAQVANYDTSGQVAAFGPTTIYTVPAAAATVELNQGQYRISWNAKVVTAAGSSSTLGPLSIIYTDPDGVSVTLTCAAQIAAGTIANTSTANTTGTVLIGIPVMINCQATSVIQIQWGYASNAANTMRYNLHVALEAM